MLIGRPPLIRLTLIKITLTSGRRQTSINAFKQRAKCLTPLDTSQNVRCTTLPLLLPRLFRRRTSFPRPRTYAVVAEKLFVLAFIGTLPTSKATPKLPRPSLLCASTRLRRRQIRDTMLRLKRTITSWLTLLTPVELGAYVLVMPRSGTTTLRTFRRQATFTVATPTLFDRPSQGVVSFASKQKRQLLGERIFSTCATLTRRPTQQLAPTTFRLLGRPQKSRHITRVLARKRIEAQSRHTQPSVLKQQEMFSTRLCPVDHDPRI